MFIGYILLTWAWFRKQVEEKTEVEIKVKPAEWKATGLAVNSTGKSTYCLRRKKQLIGTIWVDDPEFD